MNMTKQMRSMEMSVLLMSILLISLTGGCGEDISTASEGTPPDPVRAASVRQTLCAQNWDTAARKGSGAEPENASLLWSVSPYHLLVPSTGEGYTRLNIDAPHYDWLIYTTADVDIASIGGPSVKFSGPVEECPELNLVEYYAHHEVRAEWHLRLRGEAMSRALFYAGLVETEHSDPNDAGHASHIFEDHGEGDEAAHEASHEESR